MRIRNKFWKELYWSIIEAKGFWATLGFLTALALFVFYLFVRTR